MEATSFVLDGSRTIQRLARQGRTEVTREIEVQFVAVAPPGTKGPAKVSPTGVELSLVSPEGVVS